MDIGKSANGFISVEAGNSSGCFFSIFRAIRTFFFKSINDKLFSDAATWSYAEWHICFRHNVVLVPIAKPLWVEFLGIQEVFWTFLPMSIYLYHKQCITRPNEYTVWKSTSTTNRTSKSRTILISVSVRSNGSVAEWDTWVSEWLCVYVNVFVCSCAALVLGAINGEHIFSW